MLELPEAQTIARQLRDSVRGREIVDVIANSSPHKFAFFTGDPEGYKEVLVGCRITDAQAFGGLVELTAGDEALVLGDGVSLRLLASGDPLPAKHQLAVRLDDGSALVASVQMYGGMWLAPPGGLDSPYYRVARERPSPLGDAFDRAWFDQLWTATKPSASVKALLATEQRIPGLGNGVLQDILFVARVHPRTRLDALTSTDRGRLFDAVKTTLAAMTNAGGRDTEKDLYGAPGGYRTLLSAKTIALPCPVCGGGIVREAYMGGNVYFCPACQPRA